MYGMKKFRELLITEKFEKKKTYFIKISQHSASNNTNYLNEYYQHF